MKITITRYYSDLNSTMGVLTCDKLDTPLYTCERAWKFNKQNESCIPTGIYKAIKHKSPKHGNCFWLQDVTDRSEILMHIGNYWKETQGCILVGEQAGTLYNECAVLRSRNAMNTFLKICDDEIIVEIK